MLPQEIEILEQHRKEKLAQLEWSTKLNRWQTWLDTDKADVAEANIKAIDDPFAARALVKHLEQNRGAMSACYISTRWAGSRPRRA